MSSIRTAFTAASAATVALLILTGCAAQAPVHGSVAKRPAADTASPKSTPAPTPTVLSAAEAAPVLQKALCTSNAQVNPFNAALNGTDLAALKTAAQNALNADTETYTTLSSTKWPANVTADVADVAKQYSIQMGVEGSIINSPDLQSALSASDALSQVVNDGASQRVRVALGLPSDPMAGC